MICRDILARERAHAEALSACDVVVGPHSSEIAVITPFVISPLINHGNCRPRGDLKAVAIATKEGVVMNFKQRLMACTALLGVLLFHPATAGAQSAEAQKIERLERQTELLQRQLKEIQEELA